MLGTLLTPLIVAAAVATIATGLALATRRAYKRGHPVVVVAYLTARTAARAARLALDYRHGATTGTYRRAWRRATYQPASRGHADTPRPLPGRVARAYPTPAGARLLLTLPSGAHPGDLDAERVASAMRARRATITHSDLGPRHAVVRLTRDDHLTGLVPLPTITTPVDLAAVPIGIDEDGNPWTLPLRGSHLLIGGVTGSGKGSIIHNLLRSCEPMLLDRSLVAWGVDPKGGMELGMARGTFERLEEADPYAMVDLLEEAGQRMRERALLLAGHHRTHQPEPGDPHVLVVVDEVANLTAYHPDSRLRSRAKAALGLLTTQGRAPGLTVIAALQDPRVEVLSIRNLFPVRVALRCDEARQVDMILGDGARARGALADQVSEQRPGTGYVARDGSREVLRVRAAFVPDAEVRRVAAAVARARAHASAGAPSQSEGPARAHARAHDPVVTPLGLLGPGSTQAQSRRDARRAANRAEHRARQAARAQARRADA